MKNSIRSILYGLAIFIASLWVEEYIIATRKLVKTEGHKPEPYNTELTDIQTTMLGDSTPDCLRYMVELTLKTEGFPKKLIQSCIIQRGSGCVNNEIILATQSSNGAGWYNGEFIIQDFQPQNKKMVDLFESDPKTYKKYQDARDAMIATYNKK